MLDDLQARFPAPHASRAALTDLAIVEQRPRRRRPKRAFEPAPRKPDAYTDPMNAIFLMAARDYAPAAERASTRSRASRRSPPRSTRRRRTSARPPKVWTQVGIEAARSAKPSSPTSARSSSARCRRDKDHVEGRRRRRPQKAYADYAHFLENDVLPHGGDDFAAGARALRLPPHEGYFLNESADGARTTMGQRIFDAHRGAR